MFASIRRSFSGEMYRTRINKLILRPNLPGIANEIVSVPFFSVIFSGRRVASIHILSMSTVFFKPVFFSANSCGNPFVYPAYFYLYQTQFVKRTISCFAFSFSGLLRGTRTQLLTAKFRHYDDMFDCKIGILESLTRSQIMGSLTQSACNYLQP